MDVGARAWMEMAGTLTFLEVPLSTMVEMYLQSSTRTLLLEKKKD